MWRGKGDMKQKIVLVIMLGFLSVLCACSDKVKQTEKSSDSVKIYLYGEAHGVAKVLDKEFELWNDYYQNQGMRHLFVELPYYTAEYLNLWMQSDNDDILEEIFVDTQGTAGNTSEAKEFYQTIKRECPETIFHGTDVGHQYDTTGERFITYLTHNDMSNSEQFKLTQEAIQQGKYFYEHSDDFYRENKMVENFIREFEQLDNESIMGIYGSAHTGLDAKDFTGSIPCMANQLSKTYKDIIYSEDISYLAQEIDPIRVDTISVAGKDYQASYFGKADISTWSDKYISREFWRLENAYDDFKNNKAVDNVLPYNNYPMLIETGQIFVIDYTEKDGAVIREYYIADGTVWMSLPSTRQIVIQ